MTMFFAKKLNKKGFTLAELLIVVAIIAILIAIAVPIFMNSLEKARYAVHSSNGRAMKSMAVSELLGSEMLAKQNLTKQDYWIAAGTYDFTSETMKISAITKITSGGATTKVGMWMQRSTTASTVDADTLAGWYDDLPASTDGDEDITSEWVKFTGNNEAYSTIGRVATAGLTVSYVFVFSSADLSDISFGS